MTLVQASLWLGFAGQVDRYEIIGAAVGACVATGAVAVVHAARPVHGWPLWQDVARLWRVPWDVATGLAAIGRALWRKAARGEEGEMVVTCYTPAASGGTRAAAKHDGGRRMLMTTFISATPASLVLGGIRRGRRMVVHQLLRGAKAPGIITSARRPKRERDDA